MLSENVNLQVLTGDPSLLSWEPSSHGRFVADALTIDKMGGEEIFVGRAPFSNSKHPGRVQPSHQCLYIPFDGREHRIESYEVLVLRKTPQAEIRFDTTERIPLLPLHRDKLTASSGPTRHGLVRISSPRCEWS
jgi:Protein of unknown function (DUF3421)